MPVKNEAETSRLWPVRFELLDACRGVASLAVLLDHVADKDYGIHAVMVFFVISGYCIAAAATSCARSGTGFRVFMFRRIRRIFPPYLASVALFTLTRLVKVAMGHEQQLSGSILAWLQNGTLTQWLTISMKPISAPWDNPTLFVTAYWSLCYEEQFYLVMAILAVVTVRRGTGFLGATLVLMTLGAFWNVVEPHLATGFFLEYWVPFGIGVILYHRLCAREGTARLALDGVVGSLLLGGWWLAWSRPAAGGARDAGTEWLVASSFYFVLVLGRSHSTAFASTGVGRGMGWLGKISYSLYLIHQFNLAAGRRVASLVTRGAETSWPSLCVQVLYHGACAAGFWRLFEKPFLNRPSVEPTAEKRT